MRRGQQEWSADGVCACCGGACWVLKTAKWPLGNKVVRPRCDRCRAVCNQGKVGYVCNLKTPAP
jgi:hypothetical protein